MDGRKGAETERLTDLLSRTFPAESHLSETPLPPAVGGHGPPDKERHRTVAEGRGSHCVFAAAVQAGAVHPSTYVSASGAHLHALVFLCSSVCVQIQAMRRISSNYGP